MIKSRIAPTPSGLLHQGNAFNFLLTAAITAQQGGELRLRIDDLDKPRIRPEYLEDIFKTLEWLKIDWHAGPRSVTDHVAHYSQEYRLTAYQLLLDRLTDTGSVYACTCSRNDILHLNKNGIYPGTCRLKNLPLNTPNASWRLVIPENTIIRIEDVLLGNVSFNLSEKAGDVTIRRRDGLPAYHIASLADDTTYEINMIIRGEDLLLSTAVQLYLARLLALDSFRAARFFHHPLIMDAAGTKMSKSAGSTSIRVLRETGAGSAEFHSQFERWQRQFSQK